MSGKAPYSFLREIKFIDDQYFVGRVYARNVC